jgi:cation transport regulator ChaB
MELNQAAIEKAIVETAVNEVLGRWDPHKGIDAEIKKRIDKLFTERAEQQITAAINQAIEDGFDREYRRVDSWGQPQGQPTTIRKQLEDSISDYWNKKVDSNGKPTDSTYNGTTRAQYVMVKACGEDFHKLVQQNAINVTAELKDALRAQLRGFVDETLKNLFKVATLQDKAEGRSYG